MGSVGVVIPVLNQFEKAVEMISSLKSEQRKIETIVIPNHRLRIPLSATWNRGIDEVFAKGHEFALVCNDDILLAPYTVDALYWAAKNSEHAVVTARNLRGTLASPYDILEYPEGFGSDQVLSQVNDFVVSGGPDFACFMIGWGAWNHVGRFDENFTPAYFEDNDYHRRINLAGMTAGTVEGAHMYHYGSQTQNANPNKPVCPPDAFVKNRHYFVRKWGGEPGVERYDTPFNDPTKTWKDW